MIRDVIAKIITSGRMTARDCSLFKWGLLFRLVPKPSAAYLHVEAKTEEDLPECFLQTVILLVVLYVHSSSNKQDVVNQAG